MPLEVVEVYEYAEKYVSFSFICSLIYWRDTMDIKSMKLILTVVKLV